MHAKKSHAFFILAIFKGLKQWKGKRAQAINLGFGSINRDGAHIFYQTVCGGMDMQVLYIQRRWTRVIIAMFVMLVLATGLFINIEQEKDDTYYGLAVSGLVDDRKMLAIIIDGFGESDEGLTELMGLPVKLTCSVMPFGKKAASHARIIKGAGKEVIVQIPMEDTGKDQPKKYIKDSFSPSEVAAFVNDCVKRVDVAVGADCYRGAKASANLNIMREVLKCLQGRNIKYYVDNRNNESGAAKLAGKEVGFNVADRNVYIDKKPGKEAIKKQLLLAGDIAIKYGKAIAIGHAGQKHTPQLAQAIQEVAPQLEEMGVELVFVSELFG